MIWECRYFVLIGGTHNDLSMTVLCVDWWHAQWSEYDSAFSWFVIYLLWLWSQPVSLIISECVQLQILKVSFRINQFCCNASACEKTWQPLFKFFAWNIVTIWSAEILNDRQQGNPLRSLSSYLNQKEFTLTFSKSKQKAGDKVMQKASKTSNRSNGQTNIKGYLVSPNHCQLL